MKKIVIEPEGLLSVDGLEGVVIFPLAEVFLPQEEHGRVTLLHAGGEIEAPASSSMMESAKKYKDGTKLKIKSRVFRTSCSTLYLTTGGRWKLEACINPIEQKEGCYCGMVVYIGFS